MRRCRRIGRAVLIALVGTGALSGCYYDVYTGYWRPYPWYYPYPYGYTYPYPSPYYAYPPPPAQAPAPGGAAPQHNAPVQRAPLPPPAS
jgi:hypothetical protein